MAIKPTFVEVSNRLLTGEVKDNLLELISFFKELRLSPRWYATNAFNFKYKGKMILRFTIGNGLDNIPDRVDIFFTLSSLTDLEQRLYDIDDEKMFEFYFDNIRKCINCNPKHGGGRTIHVLGKTIRGLCIPGEMRIINPTKEQIEYLKKFVHYRRKIIIDDIEVNKK